MARVIFGATSSPFLLAATLRHHFKKMKSVFPETAERLRRSAYVDDHLTGAESEEGARIFCTEAIKIFRAAGMKIHKWGSNSAALAKMLEENGPDERPLRQQTGLLKVLSLTWKPNEDSLSFSAEHVIEFAFQRRNTKRFVRQTTARLYDPLGFLSPFVVRAKILFQEIWRRSLRWDDTLPEELMSGCNSWCDELTTLQRVNVPRFYDSELKGNVVHRTLHVFSDASTSAYESMIFLCSTDDTGVTTRYFSRLNAVLRP